MESESAIGVRVEFDMEEVHNISVDLLTMMEEDKITMALGVAALALSIGRLCSDKVLSIDEEIKFSQDLMEYLGMYFHEGEVN